MSIRDVISDEKKIPLVMGLWSIGAVLAPVMAPLLGASMMVAKGWRYIFWLLTWVATANFVLLFFFLPETLSDNVLYRRCRRIKKMTGIDAYCTLRQQDEKRLDILQFLLEAILRPFRIIARKKKL